MGMSASQARLMSLTSRLSDLELRAQQISNSKIRLSMDSEKISKDYADALDKEKITIITGYNGTNPVYSDLSYDNLTGVDSPLMTQYGVSNSNGALLVTKEQADNYVDAGGSLEAFLAKYSSGAVTNTVFPEGVTETQYNNAKTLVGTTEATYNQSVIKTQSDLTALNTYGATHVKGYSSAGQWQYSTTKEIPGVVDQTEEIQEAAADAMTATNAAVSSAKALGVTAASTTADTAKAAASTMNSSPTVENVRTLQGALDSLYEACDAYATVTGNAVVKAEEDVARFEGFYTTDGEGNRIPEAHLANALRRYDLAVARDNVARDTLEDVSNAIRLTNVIVSIRDSAPPADPKVVTVNYNSTSNPDAITYTPTGEETNASVSAKYVELLSAYKSSLTTQSSAETNYNNAVTEFNKLGAPTNVTTPGVCSNPDYYTNLFKRMEKGYVTVENEDKTLDNPQWLQDQLMHGNLIMEKVDSEGKWNTTSYGSDTNFIEKSDDKDLAKAEAQYEADMSKVQSKDKRFDLQLTEINTEHKAIETEVDSVKKVIDKNIERAFKTFDA